MKSKMIRSANLRKVTRDYVSEAWGMSHPDAALRATGVRHIYLICMIDSQLASLIEHIQNWAALKLCCEYEYISLEAWR